MLTWLLIPGCSIINRLRGWGPDNKVARLATSKIVSTPLLLGILVQLLYNDLGLSIIAGLGYQLYTIWGWGDYFDFSTLKNKEVGFIDRFVSRFLHAGPYSDMVSMSIRAMFGYPTFIALAIYHASVSASVGEAPGSLVPLLAGLLLLLQGPIYYLLHTRFMYYTEKAEVLVGAVWGASLWLSLI